MEQGQHIRSIRFITCCSVIVKWHYEEGKHCLTSSCHSSLKCSWYFIANPLSFTVLVHWLLEQVISLQLLQPCKTLWTPVIFFWRKRIKLEYYQVTDALNLTSLRTPGWGGGFQFWSRPASFKLRFHIFYPVEPCRNLKLSSARAGLSHLLLFLHLSLTGTYRKY